MDDFECARCNRRYEGLHVCDVQPHIEASMDEMMYSTEWMYETAAWRAFQDEMKELQYGPEETNQAWHFFLKGWQGGFQLGREVADEDKTNG